MRARVTIAALLVLGAPAFADEPDYDTEMNAARAAFQKGEYGKALHHGEAAVRAVAGEAEQSGKPQQAMSIAAMAACKLKHTEKARFYIPKLSKHRRAMAVQICKENGIEI
jgi:hypothetical protein